MSPSLFNKRSDCNFKFPRKRVHFKIKFNHAAKLKYQYEAPVGMNCEIVSSTNPVNSHQDRLVCEWTPELSNWDMHKTSFCFIAYGTVFLSYLWFHKYTINYIPEFFRKFQFFGAWVMQHDSCCDSNRPISEKLIRQNIMSFSEGGMVFNWCSGNLNKNFD